MRLALLLISLVFVAACTKKRDESFVQGQGRDLLLISDFDGKEINIETLDLLTDFKENPALSASEKVTQSKDSPLAKMGAVQVNPKPDLLGDVPFIALPKQKTGYKIKYVLTNEYLVVLKVVSNKSLIHPKELPGAIDQGNGEIGIPLVGYPLRGLISLENVEQNGAKSNKLLEMSVADKTSAKYFKIDKNNRVIYRLQDKMDLFPKSYFAGEDGNSEWFFSQTIIAAGGENADYAGYVLAQQDQELNSLSKVKFVFNRNEMRAASVNVDSRINNNDEINQTILVKFPIDWKEYRATPSGAKGFAMSEEENTSIDWEKRRYVKVDFARASTITLASPNFRFVDLEVDTNYFSFTLYDAGNNLRIKQSFLRDHGRKKYVPKRMFKEDFEKFGFFDTQKHEVKNYEKYRQEDFGKNIFINRFNVANGVVEFHFTEGSDERLIPYAAKAADEWSEAFQKAGVPLKVVAITDKDKRVRLGDLRYNQINLIRSANESNLFGYGPSITDPRTGEIVSATTNIHVTSIVSALVGHIRDYLLFKSGQTKKLSMFVDPPVIADQMVLKGDKVSMVPGAMGGVPVNKLLKKMPVLGLNGQIQMKEIEIAEPKARKDAQGNLIRPKNWGREFDISITGKNLNREIENLCPELEAAAKALESGTPDSKENEMVIACAEKLLPTKMFGTLLHEMGHNFGLRHNFYGSVDAINFLSKNRTGTSEQVNSSSVMEYPSFGEDRLTKVGLYDIAALRYGYGDSIETNNCSVNAAGEKECAVLKLDPTKTIDQNLSQKGQQRRPYMFCTDDDVAVGTDPMCARHDAGTTPEAVVQNLINEYNSTIADYNYRMGRQRKIDPMRLTNYRVQRFWIPLKRIYDEWRYRLNDHLGIGNEYLESFDSQKLNQAVSQKIQGCDAKTDPNSSDCQLKFYQQAADRVFKFAMQMATLPPRYCLGNRNGQMASVEFADVRRIIVAVNKFVPKSCMDPEVQKYIESKYAFVPMQESGYELEDVRLDMKVKMSGKTDFWGNPIPEPPDIIGLMPEKVIAMEVLTVRASLSMSAEEKPFRPNFLDEPKYREEVLSYMADRVTKGISAKKMLSGGKVDQISPFMEKFKYEKKYLDSMIYSVFSGLDVPDKSLATKQRKKKYAVVSTDKKEWLDKAKYKVADMDGTTFYVILNEEATEAKKLLQVLEVLPKRLEAASPLDGNTFDGLIELSKSILGEKEESVSASKYMELIYSVLEDEYPDNAKAVRTSDQKNIDKYRPHWKSLLQKEVAALRPLLQEISANRETAEYMTSLSVYASDIEQYKNPKKAGYMVDVATYLNPIANVLFADGYVLTHKSILERIERYKAERLSAGKSSTESNDDIYNFEELQTQMDLIMRLLQNNMDYKR